MTLTPWGDSSQLRERKLAPGQRLSPESVARSQRARLLGAMVAAVAEHGYERTAVKNVVDLSGTSRSAFYAQFANKEDCFAVAVGETVDFALAEVGRAHAEAAGDPDAGLGAALTAFAGLVAAQPAAARACLVEAPVAGGAALARVEAGDAAFAGMIQAGFDRSPRHAGQPPAVVRAIVGGVRAVVCRRLRAGGADAVADLADDLARWALSYESPAAGLRRPRSRVLDPAPRPPDDDHVERIFAALADVVLEKGYQATTLDDVAEWSGISLSTFYSHFRTKRDAFLAAYDAGTTRTLAAALPPFRRAPDWPHGVRAALGGLLTHLARAPEWAHSATVEVLAAGEPGLERRDRELAALTELLAPGQDDFPDAPAIATDAVAGAIFELIRRQVRDRGADRLLDLLPTATFVALAPFTGADQAAAVANERARRRVR